MAIYSSPLHVLPPFTESTEASLLPLCHLTQDAVAITQALVQCPSETPAEGGCYAIISHYLTRLGFTLERLDTHGVSNLVAYKQFSTKGPCIAFAGHVDVVPAGSQVWQSPPFAAHIVEGEIIGRGVVDMKGAIACFMAALNAQIMQCQQGELYILLTSDEEGEAEFGTAHIVNVLQARGVFLDGCIVGEPSSTIHAADTLKVGRRGAISATLTINGKAGHVAYPQFAINAGHIATDICQALLALQWDEGSSDFPGSSLQITGISTGSFTDNVIPATARVCFNLRYSHVFDEQAIKTRIEQTIKQCLHAMSSQRIAPALAWSDEQCELSWQRGCEPYFTERNGKGWALLPILESAIKQQLGHFVKLSTSGGTSDGRFIKAIAGQVVELGLVNRTIHQVNERTSIADIEKLTQVYVKTLELLFDE